jgi:protein TonB
MVDVVVLSEDVTLFEAIRHAVGERNPVWRARSAEESVDLLLTGRCGVLLIDLAAVTARPATLVEQIVDQFPGVVVVVAGRREDEAVLAGLVSDGLVYRFMHKPLSPKRAGMFLNAAIRSHVERREGRGGEQLLPLVRELQSRVDPRKWLFIGSGLLIFLAVLAAVLITRYGRPAQPDPATLARSTLPATPLADPVLSRARAALAAGRYEAPPGRNALDLYAAALLTRPDDAEARQGLQTTITRLVETAERAAAAGDTVEARRLARRVLEVDAGNAGALAVIASLTFKPSPVPAAVTVAPQVESAAAAPTREPVSSAPVVAATPPPPPPPTAAPVVRPDPLAPRVVGSGKLPTSSGRTPLRRLTYDPSVPAAPVLPIAGYEKNLTQAAVTPAHPAVISAAPGMQQRDLSPLATPDPTYPPAAFRDGITGWVEVEFTVNELGATRDVAVIDSQPRGVFDDAAIAAVADWKYQPRIVNGQPVAQRTAVTLRFNVED